MAITEPDVGSDSGAIRTTAIKDGDEYVLNGEKIFVTSGERAELVVVWATLDRSPGQDRDQVLRGPSRQPRPAAGASGAQARHPRLRHRRLRPRRLPRARRGPPRATRRSRSRAASVAPCRPSTTRVRSWRRWHWA
uniref:Acyl-CoA dehydrogenase family protein n=1 Tax=Janibacter limosus TaxID=53458 RepID=A0AC61U2Y5_9MICO|nr:acyl-CoA dehydrogenase family protein [Janibacter limosus]